MLDTGYMTAEEHEAMDAIGRAHAAICKVIRQGGDEAVENADINEAVLHVHALQQMVLSNAAARTYPDRYRLLGKRPRP